MPLITIQGECKARWFAVLQRRNLEECATRRVVRWMQGSLVCCAATAQPGRMQSKELAQYTVQCFYQSILFRLGFPTIVKPKPLLGILLYVFLQLLHKKCCVFFDIRFRII